jgi:hypothetical protein
MRRQRITAGGQLSIPAAIRHRWGTHTVGVEDLGDRIVVWPLPEDPIAAARGAFKGRIGSTEELRAQARVDDEAAQTRR